MKPQSTKTNPTQLFLAKVLINKHEEVGVFASSEEDAKGKIIALYEEKSIDVLHVSFVEKTEESCDKKDEVPTEGHSIPK